jgi:hypothetical protein
MVPAASGGLPRSVSLPLGQEEADRQIAEGARKSCCSLPC